MWNEDDKVEHGKLLNDAIVAECPVFVAMCDSIIAAQKKKAIDVVCGMQYMDWEPEREADWVIVVMELELGSLCMRRTMKLRVEMTVSELVEVALQRMQRVLPDHEVFKKYTWSDFILCVPGMREFLMGSEPLKRYDCVQRFAGKKQQRLNLRMLLKDVVLQNFSVSERPRLPTKEQVPSAWNFAKGPLRVNIRLAAGSWSGFTDAGEETPLIFARLRLMEGNVAVSEEFLTKPMPLEGEFWDCIEFVGCKLVGPGCRLNVVVCLCYSVTKRTHEVGRGNVAIWSSNGEFNAATQAIWMWPYSEQMQPRKDPLAEEKPFLSCTPNRDESQGPCVMVRLEAERILPASPCPLPAPMHGSISQNLLQSSILHPLTDERKVALWACAHSLAEHQEHAKLLPEVILSAPLEQRAAVYDLLRIWPTQIGLAAALRLVGPEFR